MKIAFISDCNPNDKDARSGVPYNLSKQLSKENEIIWIKPNIHPIPFFFVRLFYFIGNKIFNMLGYNMSVTFPFYSWLYSKSVEKQLNKIEHVDAIFTILGVYIAYLKTDIPILYRTDGTYNVFANYYEKDIPNCIVNIGNKQDKKITLRCNCILVPSLWLKERLIKDYGVEAENILFVESGTSKEIPDIIQNKDFRHKNLKFLFIGKDTKRKGIDIAYNIVKELNENYGFNSTLDIIGGEVDSYIKESSFVNWVGYLNLKNKKDEETFNRILINCHILLFPTQAEFAGIVSAEASGYGLPVFSFDTGGVSSYVRNGENGYCLPLKSSYKDFASKINECFESNELEILSKNGIYLTKTIFNWDRWGQIVNSHLNNLK